METIKQVLMRRDGMSAEEAEDLIFAAREELYYRAAKGDTEAHYEVCYDYFGLEPDYAIELIFS